MELIVTWLGSLTRYVKLIHIGFVCVFFFVLFFNANRRGLYGYEFCKIYKLVVILFWSLT